MVRKPGPTLLGESFRARHHPQKVVVCLLGEPNENRDSDDPANDVAPRSLKGVLAAVEKNTAPSSRREQ
jgi:hypothetical protein